MKFFLNISHSLRNLALAGGVLGLAYALWLLPVAHIAGKSNLWLIGDCGAHASALRAYLNDGWHASILTTNHLNYPQGINIAFADVIPLLAVPIKILAPFLPADFHYFGYWLVFSYVIQGAAACVLLFSCGVRRWLWLLIATMVFLLSPAMLFRVHAHTSLTTHGYLLIALILYFKIVRQGAGYWVAVGAYALLCAVSLLTHPYLLAMVFPVFVAAALDDIRYSRCLRSVAAMALVIAPTMALLWFGGYLAAGAGGLSGGGGFGFFSMNMVAPLVGGDILDLSAWRDHSGIYYGCYPVPYDATGGQYEGYNHLGLGVLLALAVVVAFQGRWLLSKIGRYPALILLITGFACYAVSNKGFFAGWQLWSLHLPQFLNTLTDQFRASGRFFWPVGAAATLVALVGLSRFRSPRTVTCTLMGVLLIQLIDTAPMRAMTHEKIALSAPVLLNTQWWLAEIKRAEALYLFPVFGCGAHPHTAVAPLQHLAVTNAVPFNSGMIARGYINCAVKETELDAGLKAGSMYLFLADHYTKEELERRFGHEVFTRYHSCELGHVFRP